MSNDNNERLRALELLVKIGCYVTEDKRNAKKVADHLQILINEPSRGWREDNGVIRFSVTSNGWSRYMWFDYFKMNSYLLAGDVKFLLLLDEAFKPTPCGSTTDVAILKASILKDTKIPGVLKEMKNRKFVPLSPEIFCLVRQKFSDEDIREMGLWYILAMHEPITDTTKNQSRLAIDLDHDFGSVITSDYRDPRIGYGPCTGFACEVPRRREVRPFIG